MKLKSVFDYLKKLKSNFHCFKIKIHFDYLKKLKSIFDYLEI